MCGAGFRDVHLGLGVRHASRINILNNDSLVAERSMSRKNQNAKGRPPEPEDEHDRKLLADVERHGWHVIGVEEADEGPAFAYSIGLYHNFQHPEVILFGLPVRVMHRVINAVGEKIKSGEKFDHLDESGMFSTTTTSPSVPSSEDTTAITLATPAGSTVATTFQPSSASGPMPSTAIPGTLRSMQPSLSGNLC